MSNASRCRSIAAYYATRAEAVSDPEAKRACWRLEALWRDIAPLAANFDRWSDPRSKELIYAMIDSAAEARRKVA